MTITQPNFNYRLLNLAEDVRATHTLLVKIIGV